jgi:hypothetical protein
MRSQASIFKTSRSACAFWFPFFATLAAVIFALPSSAQPVCMPIKARQYYLVSDMLRLEDISYPNSVMNDWESSYSMYVFDDIDYIWTPHYPHLIRGSAHAIRTEQDAQLCFHEPTAPPVLPLNVGNGGYGNHFACQSNVIATFEAIVGRAPMEGTVLYRLAPGGYPYELLDSTNFLAYRFTNGVWSPSAPQVPAGQGVYILQSGVFSYQPQLRQARVAGNHFTFNLETVYGVTLMVEYSTNRNSTNWQTLTNFVGDGFLKTVSDPASTDAIAERYYRARVP